MKHGMFPLSFRTIEFGSCPAGQCPAAGRASLTLSSRVDSSGCTSKNPIPTLRGVALLQSPLPQGRGDKIPASQPGPDGQKFGNGVGQRRSCHTRTDSGSSQRRTYNCQDRSENSGFGDMRLARLGEPRPGVSQRISTLSSSSA